MDLFTLILAAAPGLLIAIYIYYKDIHEPEPHKYLIWCFLFGVISTMPAIWLEKFGMGFATLENILYAEYGLQTTIVRAFTAVPAHAAFAVIMGYYVGMAKFEKQNRTLLLAQGFLGAVILHGAYDFFIFQNNFPALTGLTIVTLVIGIVLSRRMIKIHQQMSPFNTDNIEPMATEISNELDFIPDEKEEDEEDEPFSLL